MDAADILEDIKLVHAIDRELSEDLPLFYNYSMMGGYYNMPSARMNRAGLVSLGASFPSPYNIYGLNIQPLDRLELSANYLIYKGILEPGFGKEGFGDDAERMGNIKLGILTPAEDLPFLPLFAIGAQDFIGTKRFNAQYMVATQCWKAANVELTLGFGRGRIKGFFGGAAWSPFRNTKLFFLRDLTMQLEYDANDYKKNPGEHIKARVVKSRWNAGLSLLAWRYLQLSLSSVRGDKLAGSASLRYPLGTTKGFFPKTADAMLYRAPVNTEPLGVLRKEQELAQELAHALSEQGLDLYVVYLKIDKGQKQLWLQIVNNRYRNHEAVKERIVHVLAALLPSNIDDVFVGIEATALSCQSYHFRVHDLYRYRAGLIGFFEMDALSPMRSPLPMPSRYEGVQIFRRTRPLWTFTIRPRLVSFFGSTSGKFKFNLGVVAGPEGYLFDTLYYKVQGSYSVAATTAGMTGVDRLNPSHMFVVRSDSMKYYKANTAHLDQAFLQRSWHLGRGFFYRLATGFFETAYAGAATELLYYPASSPFAVGVECATVWKREYEGLRFFTKVPKFDGTKTEYLPFTGVQYFVDLYYDYKPLSWDCKITAGRFLAKDKGARFEIGKYFVSGMRFSLWYTLTNAQEDLNGHRYHDKGFAFLLPLDMFLKQSSRNFVGYAMSAWLRDQGAQADTGKKLYSILSEERFFP